MKLATVGLIVLAMVVAMPGIAFCSIVQYYDTVYDTDAKIAGVGGVRGGDGEADIVISGAAGTVTKAYLYWHGPSNVTDASANQNITFDGTNIAGTHLGLADDNCWDFNNSHAYRADVTSLVSGSGTYTVSNLIKPNVDINGLTLMVFHDDGDDTNNRDVVIFDGNDSNKYSFYDPQGWDVMLSGIDYDSGTVLMQLGVSDGQVWEDTPVIVNSTQITVGNHIFEGDTVPDDGTAGNTYGGLWDLKVFDVTSLLSPGLNNLHMTSDYINDCLSLIHVAIDLPAGAAPAVIPEPASVVVWSLLGGLAVSFTWWRRRKK